MSVAGHSCPTLVQTASMSPVKTIKSSWHSDEAHQYHKCTIMLYKIWKLRNKCINKYSELSELLILSFNFAEAKIAPKFV